MTKGLETSGPQLRSRARMVLLAMLAIPFLLALWPENPIGTDGKPIDPDASANVARRASQLDVDVSRHEEQDTETAHDRRKVVFDIDEFLRGTISPTPKPTKEQIDLANAAVLAAETRRHSPGRKFQNGVAALARAFSDLRIKFAYWAALIGAIWALGGFKKMKTRVEFNFIAARLSFVVAMTAPALYPLWNRQGGGTNGFSFLFYPPEFSKGINIEFIVGAWALISGITWAIGGFRKMQP